LPVNRSIKVSTRGAALLVSRGFALRGCLKTKQKLRILG